MARNDPQTNIRIPPELKKRLMDAAKASGRTFGAEIVYRLQESIELDDATPMEDLDVNEKIRHIDKRYQEIMAKIETLDALVDEKSRRKQRKLESGSK